MNFEERVEDATASTSAIQRKYLRTSLGTCGKCGAAVAERDRHSGGRSAGSYRHL